MEKPHVSFLDNSPARPSSDSERLECEGMSLPITPALACLLPAKAPGLVEPRQAILTVLCLNF